MADGFFVPMVSADGVVGRNGREEDGMKADRRLNEGRPKTG
ncbi:hypothetical protein [uncultured Bacteroides sp.]|nr:hypothetical protein [uncultured Bacteroides sp.]